MTALLEKAAHIVALKDATRRARIEVAKCATAYRFANPHDAADESDRLNAALDALVNCARQHGAAVAELASNR